LSFVVVETATSLHKLKIMSSSKVILVATPAQDPKKPAKSEEDDGNDCIKK
jgi:hypothetical protein